MLSQKASIDELVNILKQWQYIEDSSVLSTTEILKQTSNPLLHIVMEIIRQDSIMHRRVQQLVIDHLEKSPITLNPDDFIELWSLVEEHDEIEKHTIELAKQAIQKTNSSIAKFLINYLLIDENKHETMLEELEKIKKDMHPYSGM